MVKKSYNIAVSPNFGGGGIMTYDAAAVSSGLAFLESELEKKDPLLREPLTAFNYPRDIVVESGGGWVEATSAMNVDISMTGGEADAVGGVQNNIRRIQADFSKDLYKVLPYEAAMSVKIQDQLRGAVTGRSIEQVYEDGIRLDYNKYLDINTYLGQTKYGTTGIVNDTTVVAASVATGAASSTLWKNKTAQEILNDVNTMIVTGWAAAQYDNAAIINHILIPPAQYSYINQAILSVTGVNGGISILNYLLNNNIAKNKGIDLFIGECRFLIGAGSGGTDRMIGYVNDRRFLGMDLPVPLSRIMTQPNVMSGSYDSLYMGNIGQVKVHYYEPVRYYDGI